MFRNLDLAESATPDEHARALRDVALALRIAEHLEREYPGHFFKAEVDSRGGMVGISIPALMPQGWAYRVYLSRLSTDPSMHCITKAGGEILERFHMPRGKYRSDLWEEASQKYHRLKHGIMREVDFKTGRKRFILPAELTR